MKRLTMIIFFAVLAVIACNSASVSKTNKLKQDTVSSILSLPKVNVDDTLHHLVGFINNKIPIVMNIFIHGNKVNGSMYYKKVGKYIFLKGDIDEYGQMRLKGFLENGEISDQFSGIYDNQVYKGQWSNSDKSKKFDFRLQRSDEDWVLIDSFKYKIVDSILFDSTWIYYKNKVAIHYPKAFPIPEAGYKITKVLMKKILGSAPNFKALKDSMIQNWQQWKEEVQNIDTQEDLPFTYSREYSQQVNVNYDKNLLLDITEKQDIYLGGTHDLLSWHDYSFDMYTGKFLTFDDIFAVPENVIINKIIIPGLDKYFREICEESVQEAVFDINNIDLPDGFYFTKKGMGFYYEPYNVAAFGCGFPQFEVSYDSLKPYASDFIKKRFGLQ